MDSDFSDREGGIYLSAYDEDGLLLAGRVPYGFASAIDFQEDTVQTAELNGSRWYVYDASTQVRDYGTVYVRGVCSVSAVEEEMNTLVKLAVVLLPATVLLSAVLCYSLVRRTLRPVSRMTRTAREIYEKRDLSRRIGIEGGRDEISTLAETFDTMLEQLQASFEQQKQFTSDVSHELRTPMAVILSQCDYLLADPELSGKDREAIQIIREKAKNLTRLISQLLLLSRADQNRQVLTMEKLDFCPDWQKRDGGDGSGPRRRNKILLETDMPEHLMMTGDETMLMRLWMNLAENAVSYTPPGGRVKAGCARKGNRGGGICRGYRHGHTGGGAAPYLGKILPGGFRPIGFLPFRAGPFHGAVDHTGPMAGKSGRRAGKEKAVRLCLSIPAEPGREMPAEKNEKNENPLIFL